MRRLAALLEGHGEAIECDLRSCFGVDLRDLYRAGGGGSGLTPRLAVALIGRLPADSWTMTEIRESIPDGVKADPEAGFGRWSQTDLLIAALHDRMAEMLWLYQTVHTGKGSKPKRPRPISRPGVGSRRRVAGMSVQDRLDSVDPRVRLIAELMRAGKPVPDELIDGPGR